MLARRAVLALLAFAPLAAAARAEGRGDGHGRRERRRWRGGDHDLAHQALREGRARPLADILLAVRGDLGGDVIDVELEEKGGRMVYEFKVLRPDGRLVELKVDALTAAILKDD